jgi:S-adenosylmethionine-diacylgycerolhomoserine-N-methlytransferase
MSAGEPGRAAGGQAAAMDRMYRFTRHVYDLTRRYYLLGRDRLLAQVPTSADTATLEVGCGTARNIIALARRPAPSSRLVPRQQPSRLISSRKPSRPPRPAL